MTSLAVEPNLVPTLIHSREKCDHVNWAPDLSKPPEVLLQVNELTSWR